MRVIRAQALVLALTLAGCSNTAPSSEPVSPVGVAEATRDGVRVSLALDGPALSGRLSWARARVENLGPKVVRWAGGGCNDPVSIWIDLRGAFDRGRDWPGLLGRFKAVALGEGADGSASGSYEEQSRITGPGEVPMFCTADLRINELAPGATLGMRAAWDGRVGGVAPAPAGPAVVKASFPFIGVADAVGKDVTDTRPISVVMDTTVVGVGAGAPAALSPALAIDAALADPQFATWVQAAPEVTWVNPNIVFQDGVWAIGLFKTAPDAQRPTRYGELTIDSTGQIVGRRFEP